MSTTPRDVLIEIVARQGEPLLASPLRCEGLLKDYCGEYRREIFVLISCLRVGLVDQMRRQVGPSIKLICARLALKLEQNLAISADVAKWALESWAIALGLLRPENATRSLNELFDHSARAAADPNAAPPVVDYATETPPEASSAPPADEPPPEYLASEPEPRWAAPDWANPAVVIDVYPEESGQKPGLREAVRDAQDNACLVLKAGVYHESLVIRKNLQIRAEDDSPGATVESLTASAVVLDGACLFLSRLVIKGIGGKDKKTQPAVEVKSGHLVMEDCNLTSDSATVVEVKGAQSEAFLRRCHVHDGKAGGISFAEEGAGYLEECHLYQNKLSQVVIGKGCSPVITGCKISHALMAGIYISDGGEGLIENCDIWGNAVGGVQCRRGGNPRVRYCRISTNERYGILVGEQGEGLYEYCQIFENARMGVTVSQHSHPRFASCRIFDNHGEGVEFSEQAEGELLDCEIFANQDANVLVKDKSKPQLYRCILHDGHQEGLVVGGNSEGLFEACEISANGQTGVLVLEGARPDFQKCVLHHGMENGVTTMQGAHGRFVDCEFTNHAGTALLIGDKSETRFERCHVRENRAIGVHVDDASPVFQDCVIEENGGTGFACTQNAAPRMVEGEIAENGGGLAVGSGGKGRWEQVQFIANRAETVLVAEGGRPSLYLCHIEDAEGAGLRFQGQSQGTIEDVDIVTSGGPGVKIEGGANPTLKKVRVRQGRAAGIVVQAEGGGTVEDCEASGNAGGDWVVDEKARLVRM
jgi:F-box protein 11